MIVKWDEKRSKFKAAGDDAFSWVFIELEVPVGHPSACSTAVGDMSGYWVRG